MNPREVLEFAKKNKVQIVDLKFVDLLGTWQHFSIPVEELTEGLFKDGSGLDGSSIRGWKAINDSDLLMVPDPTTACLDPFCAVPTLSIVGNIVDPITREPYDRDPRFVAQKAEKYLQSTKIGDISYWGPEAEFFIFDQVRYDQTGHSGFYFIDSEEGAWNIGQEGHNLGGKIRHKEGYFPVPPTDTQQDIRSEMVLEMQKAGIYDRKAPSRDGDGWSGGNRHALRLAGEDGRQADDVQVHRQERRPPTWENCDLHAQADLWRQRHRHAYAPEHLEGWEAPVCREGICRHLATLSLLHWRHPETCAGPGRVYQSDDELLQAADPRIRSAGPAGLFQPEPIGGRQDSHVLTEPQSQADRGALS